MPEEKKMSEVIFSWDHQEYTVYKKSVWWYVVSVSVLLAMVAWSVLDGRWFGGGNYLFAVFLILFYLVVIINDYRGSKIIKFAITPDGIKHGDKFYSYDEVEDFFVVYEEDGIKNLYFDLKSPIRGRLVVPLDGQNAVAVRDYLLQFLEEDLERESEPLSERLRRWLRI